MHTVIMDRAEGLYFPTLVKVTSLLVPRETLLTQSPESGFGWGCPSCAHVCLTHY